VQIKKWLRKREGILVEILTFLFAGIILVVAFLVCLLCGLPWITLIETGLGVLLALFGFYIVWIRQRNKTMLISFTSKYLLEEEEPKIDELLGILIAGRWEKLKIDPIEEFFECLKRISKKTDNYEMRRRIAEALPALFKIDFEESKDIVEILRKDWDQRWKADNRRRTIEELSFIINKDKDFVKKNLQIEEGDEIFTVFAIVEVLEELKRKSKIKDAERIFSQLNDEMQKKKFGKDEVGAISELWRLLDLINSNPDKALESFEELKNSHNLYIQICVARNVKHFCKKAREKTLELMDHFIGEEKHKYVRRPIAKEDSVDCLIDILRDKRLREKAKTIIWRLIKDSDGIIRIATFDKIEKIIDIDHELGKEIVVYVANSDPDPILRRRAENLLKKVS
jgi:hypothetical protein